MVLEEEEGLVEAIDKARTVQGQVEVGVGTVETGSCIVHNTLDMLHISQVLLGQRIAQASPQLSPAGAPRRLLQTVGMSLNLYRCQRLRLLGNFRTTECLQCVICTLNVVLESFARHLYRPTTSPAVASTTPLLPHPEPVRPSWGRPGAPGTGTMADLLKRPPPAATAPPPDGQLPPSAPDEKQVVSIMYQAMPWALQRKSSIAVQVFVCSALTTAHLMLHETCANQHMHCISLSSCPLMSC